MIISIPAEKKNKQIPIFSQDKKFNKQGIEGNFFTLIEGIYEYPQLVSFSVLKDWMLPL